MLEFGSFGGIIQLWEKHFLYLKRQKKTNKKNTVRTVAKFLKEDHLKMAVVAKVAILNMH